MNILNFDIRQIKYISFSKRKNLLYTNNQDPSSDLRITKFVISPTMLSSLNLVTKLIRLLKDSYFIKDTTFFQYWGSDDLTPILDGERYIQRSSFSKAFLDHLLRNDN